MNELASRFIELQLKDLRGIPLSEEEENLLAQMDLAAALVPGALEEMVLRHVLGIVEDDNSKEEPPLLRMATASERAPMRTAANSGSYPLRVAAASSEDSLRSCVKKAMEAGETIYTHSFVSNGIREDLKVFIINPVEESVEPIYQEGRTFIVEIKGKRSQTVTQPNGILIAISKLDKMTLSFDSALKTLSLTE